MKTKEERKDEAWKEYYKIKDPALKEYFIKCEEIEK